MGEEVKVDEVMQQLREKVRRRRAGMTPDESVTVPGHGLDLAGMDKNIRELNAKWVVKTHLPIKAHRPVLGQIAIFVKKVIRRLIRWYINPIVDQQIAFNASATRAITLLSVNVDRLLRELELANQRLARIERRLKKQGMRSKEQEKNLNPTAGEEASADIDYFLFELKYRGFSEDIKERHRAYLEHFFDCQNVLDIGCGRGEFLELLKENGIEARGIDLNAEMVEHCQERGLAVQLAEALEHLSSLPDGSLDGVFMSHLIEHLQPGYLVRLLELCRQKMGPNAPLVAETNNPLSLWAMANHFLLDLSHVKPIHPETIKFLLESAGFWRVEFRFSSPMPERMKLRQVKVLPEMSEAEKERWRAYNRNVENLNSLLYGYQDYAVIARKAPEEGDEG